MVGKSIPSRVCQIEVTEEKEGENKQEGSEVKWPAPPTFHRADSTSQCIISAPLSQRVKDLVGRVKAE